jgi:hypothetical protein
MIVLEINDIDKSSDVNWTTVQLTRAMTNQVDVLNFVITRANSSGYKPQLTDKVELIEDGTMIFGGQIVSIESEYNGLVEYTKVTCKDYSFDMDKRLVVRVYEDMTVADIIEDIKDDFLPAGYTTTNVVCPTIVKYISFNYELPTKCLQQLAQMVEYDWYVDEEKNIFFFQKGSQTAPFELTDTNQNYVYNSLKIKQDIKNMRNSIVVRGGTYKGETYTETQEADGEKTTFTYAYKYSDIVVTLDAVPLDVGVDFINDPIDHDVLYNFNEKAIKFRTDNKPTAGQIVTVTGKPHIPVVTKLLDSASIAEFGEFQFKIVDKSIGSKDAARDRARAELSAWADEINEGEFTTYQTGLKVGQKIHIQSTNRGIDDYFIISRISSSTHTPEKFKHSCTLVTKQTYGVIEFLQNLLIQKDKEIELSSDEVLDLVLQFVEQFSIVDAVTATGTTAGPYKWEPSASSNSRWNFATYQ